MEREGERKRRSHRRRFSCLGLVEGCQGGWGIFIISRQKERREGEGERERERERNYFTFRTVAIIFSFFAKPPHFSPNIPFPFFRRESKPSSFGTSGTLPPSLSLPSFPSFR